MTPTLVILAAGIGSRYGGLKQIDPVGPVGEIVLDDGPLIRCVMKANNGFAIGDRVAAEWVVVGTDDAGEHIVEPRFARAT